MKKLIKILIVEDLISDAELIKYEIKKNGILFTDLVVANKEDYLTAIHDFKPDIILSDYSLPSFDGMQALMLRMDISPSIPFILITGSINEETAVEVMKAGADDYVIKEHITRIGSAIKKSIEKNEIIRLKNEAEAKLKILSRAVEQNPASIIITNVEGNIEYVNPTFTALTGYSPDEVLGQNPRVLKSGKASSEEYKNLWETITSGHEWRGEFQNCKKNGEIYFESASICPILDDKGIVTHYLAVKEDITERKRNEKLIRTLSTAVEQSPTSIIITDAGGRIEFVNAKFTSLMQCALDEVAGKLPRVLQPGHLSSEAFETLWKELRAGNTWQVEFENRKKDGTRFIENVIISPLMENHGNTSNFILVTEDITEKREMLDDLISTEKELIQAKDKAEESDRLKTAFLHNISHEIRTPMNAIVGFSEFLNDPGLSPEKRKFFTHIIIQSSNQLLSIITDIINIATIEAGQEKIHKQEVNLNLICELIYEQYLSITQTLGIRFSYKTSLSDNEAIIITDETKLEQILTNLVGNALKFTKQGHVEFGYAVKGSFIEFYTEDTGIGISPDMHEEIFKRFRQAEFTATRQFGGSGLGLSISKAYVELLGGKIRLTSEPEKGSIFYFTIPFERSILTETSGNQQVNEFSNKLKKTKTFLIAEDDDSNFILLEEMLADLDIQIARAFNGLEAIEICKSRQIDLVLMDIKMPEMSGYEATKRIKEFLPALPVIAQTAYSLTEEKNKAMQAGFDDYITKPIKRKDLAAIVDKYCKYFNSNT